jgi:hypothetical protein
MGGAMRRSLQHQILRWGWEIQRALLSLHVNIGFAGLFVLGSVLVSISLWKMEQNSVKKLAALNSKLLSADGRLYIFEQVGNSTVASGTSEFEKILLTDSDIPFAVRSLLTLANKHGLTILRGDYRKQINSHGKFQQYQITWPIKGPASSVYQFISTALIEQRSLALRDLQFKREKMDGVNIEAKLELVLFTQLPSLQLDASLPTAVVTTP